MSQSIRTTATQAGIDALILALPKCRIAFDTVSGDPDRRAAEWVLSIGGVMLRTYRSSTEFVVP